MTHPLRALLTFLLLAVAAAYDATPEPRRVQIANLIYAGDKTSVCFSDRFLTTVETDAGIRTEKRARAVRLAREDELMQSAFAVMTGQEAFTLPEAERANLKRWLDHGGFLLASAGCSSEPWTQSFRTAIEAVFGAGCLVEIPAGHPVFSSLFKLTAIPLKGGGNARFQGVVRDGRLVCLFSKEGLNDTAHTQGCCCCGGNEVKVAEQMVANALVYALVE
jgi:hypothetical protein